MKVVLLAGGLGTRLAEQTEVRPKPMVEVGNRPMLWHIMKYCAQFGFNEFYVALGYKGAVIKQYFMDYYAMNSDVTVDLGEGSVEIHQKHKEDWQVHLIDTGQLTNTGGRLQRVLPWLDDQTFMLTYGDGVCNVDLHKLRDFHKSQNAGATITAVRPPARFGNVTFNDHRVQCFTEKSQTEAGWINGGFIMMEPSVGQYLTGDDCSLEHDMLEGLAAEGKLSAYCHDDFWQCMDTKREVDLLQRLWDSDHCPWRIWRD